MYLVFFSFSHQHLAKESLAGNKPANAVLHKVFFYALELNIPTYAST